VIRIVSHSLILAIKAYQLVVSPWIGRACRFTPGCSAYMQEAILRHGPVRGIWLGARRLGRCHPWGGSGFDPVPQHQSCNFAPNVAAR